MKYIINFTKSISIILMIFIFINCNSVKKQNKERITIELDNKNYEIALSYKPKKQTNLNRIFKQVKIKQHINLSTLQDTLLLMPIKIKTDNENYYYVLDQASYSVKKFDSDGNLINQFGRKGKGPGEVIMPMSFDISPNKNIVITDIALKRCIVFTAEENYSISLKYTPIDVSFVSDSQIVVLQCDDFKQFSTIEKFNVLKGNLELRFERLLEYNGYDDIEFIRGVITLIGEIHSNDDGNVLYFPKYMNQIICFSNEGNIKYTCTTIDDIKLPKIEMKTETSNKTKMIYGSASLPKEYISYDDVSLTKDNIFILSRKGLRENGITIVDVYSNKNGNYKYSFSLEGIGKFIDLNITEEKIYFVRPNTEIEIINYITL